MGNFWCRREQKKKINFISQVESTFHGGARRFQADFKFNLS